MSDDFIIPKKGKTFKPTSQVQKNAIECYKKLVDVTEVNENIIRENIEFKKVSNYYVKGKKDKKVVCDKKKKVTNNSNDKIIKVLDDEFDKELEILTQIKKERVQICLQQKKNERIESEIVLESETLTDFSKLLYTPKDVHDLFTEMFYDIHRGISKH
uniref:Uncharacterized protein n=1 Tax=Strongyloides papillosus TaxID=174720 RepID=A0A0N5C9Z2_STREA